MTIDDAAILRGLKGGVVALDSSAVIPFRPNKTQQLLVLARSLRAAGATLIIPEVTLIEVSKRLDAKAQRLSSDVVDLVGSAGAKRDFQSLISQLKVSHFAKAFRESFERAGAQVSSMPNLAHREIVDRMYEGRRPFRSIDLLGARSEGGQSVERGYKDLLLWRSAVEFAGSLGGGDTQRSLVLLTKNTNDFANDPKAASSSGGAFWDLHEDLTHGGAILPDGWFGVGSHKPPEFIEVILGVHQDPYEEMSRVLGENVDEGYVERNYGGLLYKEWEDGAVSELAGLGDSYVAHVVPMGVAWLRYGAVRAVKVIPDYGGPSGDGRAVLLAQRVVGEIVANTGSTVLQDRIAKYSPASREEGGRVYFPFVGVATTLLLEGSGAYEEVPYSSDIVRGYERANWLTAAEIESLPEPPDGGA